MTWIKTVSPAEGGEKLRAAFKCHGLYPPEYGVKVPALKDVESPEKGGGIVESHTLLPDTLYHQFSAYGTLLQPDLPLSRKQHEMIATVVSVANHCFY